MNKRLSSFYLVIAIIGIITAVPVLGNLLDVGKILTIILLGFSIYALIKQPKEIRKTAAILMILSCILTLIGWAVVMGAIGSVATTDMTSSQEVGTALGAVIGGTVMGMVFSLPAWVLKILAIIFSFQASSKLKNLD